MEPAKPIFLLSKLRSRIKSRTLLLVLAPAQRTSLIHDMTLAMGK
jgi:hypothetical protein